MEYRVLDQGADTLVPLEGAINEEAEFKFQQLANELSDKKKLTFDFDQVKGINSLGVRAWVVFIRTLSVGKNVSFQKCPPDVVMQINMIPSFQGNASILSFYTNYVCNSCNKTRSILIDRTTIPPKSLPQPANCPDCKNLMETEELEDEYFAFLSR